MAPGLLHQRLSRRSKGVEVIVCNRLSHAISIRAHPALSSSDALSQHASGSEEKILDGQTSDEDDDLVVQSNQQKSLTASAHKGRRRFDLTIDSLGGWSVSLQIRLPLCAFLEEKATTRSEEELTTATRWRSIPLQSNLKIRALHSLPSSSASPVSLLIVPQRDPASFLSDLPDHLSLSAICLPGTHETLARYGWPISQCQEVESTVAQQLHDGIRLMDLRVKAKGPRGQERLLAYHGQTDERIELGAVLEQVYRFLDGIGKRETVILSLKNEHGDAKLMESLLYSLHICPAASKWYLSPRIPTLGEVRGRCILFSRFGNGQEEAGGIHPPRWPDNEPSLWSYRLLTSQQLVTTQDYYNIGSYHRIPFKFSLAKQLLSETGSHPDVLGVNFLSASSIPGSPPWVTAKGLFTSGPPCLAIQGMNQRLRDHVASLLVESASHAGKDADADADSDADADADAGNLQGRRGQIKAVAKGLQNALLLDFYQCRQAPELVPLLIEANF